MPQDVRVSVNGKVFYVADLSAGGRWKVELNAPLPTSSRTGCLRMR